MVAVINFSASLRNVMNYNEHKLKQDSDVKDADGKILKRAEFIHSSGYAKDTNNLGFTDKFKRLEKQMALRERRPKSVVHISLNFDPSEKERLDKDKDLLKQIADTYMQKIGFGNQPYLVYKHNDAGHPHIHIVSTLIRNNGTAIDTNNIGRNISEPARKEIEQLFGLVVADDRKQKEAFRLQPIDSQKVIYGRSETKRAITNVLDSVLNYYKYTSLSELNAVLNLYNVAADSGGENSKVNQKKGLVYRVLDQYGNKIGVPIKASDFYNKPGLKYLQARFQKNEDLRKPFKARVRNAIDLALRKSTVTNIEQLKEALRRDKIQIVVRKNKEGRIYGLTFIDHDPKSKCVFNGSDLGKQYSVAGIEERLVKEKFVVKESVQKQEQPKQKVPENIPLPSTKSIGKTTQPISQTKTEKIQPKSKVPALEPSPPTSQPNQLLLELIKPEYSPDTIPADLKRKKKRKRKRLHL
jgi:hypothetical protein